MIDANPYSITAEFEAAIAEYAGARYGVAVESCSAALFLCCVYRHVGEVEIPRHTYPSVPAAIIHAGGRVKFSRDEWRGVYDLRPYNIIDGALRFQRDMYVYAGDLHCLSFHIKKHLAIGRGGMVLTDDAEAADWLRQMRFDGRHERPLTGDTINLLGWNMYLTPEQAARGLQLFSIIKDKHLPDLDVSEQGYPDLSQNLIYASSQWPKS